MSARAVPHTPKAATAMRVREAQFCRCFFIGVLLLVFDSLRFAFSIKPTLLPIVARHLPLDDDRSVGVHMAVGVTDIDRTHLSIKGMARGRVNRSDIGG